MRKLLLSVISSTALLCALAQPVRAQSAEGTPGLTGTIGPVDFALHGYLRAPLRLAFRSRALGCSTTGVGGSAACPTGYNLHSPWLVDDDYFNSGFAYTRLQEADWSELFFNVGNKYITATVALMGSLYSDWARPLIDHQWGIAQGYLTFNWQAETPKLKFKLQVRGGSFWDRFGYLENYDTYMFGRTHQLGAQVKLELSTENFKVWLLHGVGAHLEAIDLNQGLTMLNYLHAGVSYKKTVTAGFYFLDATEQDQRQLKEIKDANERIFGFDAKVEYPLVGRLYVAFSHIGADQSKYLSPAIEVIHSYGGSGLTSNFLGTDKSDNGTGGLYNLAFENFFSFRWLIDKYASSRLPALHGGDVTVRWFGLYTFVNSDQDDPNPVINRNQRAMFKWGVEPTWHARGWLQLGLRYDRVIMDLQDDANSFRTITPKITITTPNWYLGARIILQYSHYVYGERINLRPGQVALETLPDTDVFKIQAEVSF